MSQWLLSCVIFKWTHPLRSCFDTDINSFYNSVINNRQILQDESPYQVRQL